MGFAKKFRKRGERQLRRDARHSKNLGDSAKAQTFLSDYIFARKARGTALINVTILFFYVLHKTFGFGHSRADKVFEKAVFVRGCMADGYITHEEMLACLAEEADADFRIPESEYLRLPARKRIGAKTGDEYISLYMFALHEVFGFKKKRLERIWNEINQIAEGVYHGRITYEELEDELAEAHITLDHNLTHREERSA